MRIIENFEAMIARGQDTVLLRYGLGNEYLKAGEPARAVEHLELALAKDPGYSAAWKLYGKALTELGRIETAIAAFDNGIEIAESKGDVQAAKEMRVFRKRAEKAIRD